MTLFDNASRGIVTGGVILVWQNLKEPLCGLSLAIGLAALALGPLTQAALGFESLNGTATLPRCLTTQMPGMNTAGSLFNQYHATIYSGEYNTEPPIQDQALQRLSTDCDTGNCTWPVHSSLAVCSNVTNITAAVKEDCPPGTTYCNYMLTNGLRTDNISIDEDAPTAVAINGSSVMPTENYEDWGDFAIAKFTILNYKASRNISAYEGVFYWCVQAYNDSIVSNNVLEETVSTIWYDKDAKRATGARFLLTPPEALWAPLGLENATRYIVDSDTFSLPFIAESLNSSTDFEKGHNVLRQISWNEHLWDLQDFFTFIARSMTHRMRYDVCKDYVNGTQYGIKVVIDIHYVWLILPCLTVVMTTILFICVLKFHSPPGLVWRSNINATLFHGTVATEEMEKALEIMEMETIAESFYVRLEEVVPAGEEHRQLRLQKSDETGDDS
ncbi:hypothetical protein SLS55_004597 [Diplodia seriata]|uniref:Uncharacterized protein n=1 Tax=Diplodia seriata TaxID=420778 RepID=A0ABR3CJV5_9PEZI